MSALPPDAVLIVIDVQNAIRRVTERQRAFASSKSFIALATS
jgi:hypothetical protein